MSEKEIHRVTAQVRGPGGGTEPFGRTVNGYYFIDNNEVVLCDPDGNIVMDQDGKDYRAEIKGGIKPDSLGRVLTKALRQKLKGGGIDFSGPINYPHNGSIVLFRWGKSQP